MTREWIREAPAYWDERKAAMFEDLDPNLFGIRATEAGSPIGDEWWRVEGDGEVLGYGRLDESWGDAEVLVVVSPAVRRTGVGAFILDRLAGEADARHLNYVYNVVPRKHPYARDVERWLIASGFTEAGDGEYRKAVRRSSPR
jgi:N-acetylglutamate synthase-like GNAT family acetyltransferase